MTTNNITTHLKPPTDLPSTEAGNAYTNDGSVLSIIFDACKVESNPSDQTQAAEVKVLNFEVPVAAGSNAIVRIEARGFMAAQGPHSWVHGMLWVNGKRMVPIQNDGCVNQNFYAALSVKSQGVTALRVSITLLAQRDLAVVQSDAQLVLDTLDFSVLTPAKER